MKHITRLIFVLLSSVILISGCSGGTAAPAPVPGGSGNSSITEGVMTTSVDDNSKPTGEIKTAFPVDSDILFCSFKVNGVSKEDLIKASWTYVDGEAPAMANEVLNETYDVVQTNESSYYLAFYFEKPVNGWPKGDYKVVLSINNKEKLSVPFKLQ